MYVNICERDGESLGQWTLNPCAHKRSQSPTFEYKTQGWQVQQRSSPPESKRTIKETPSGLVSWPAGFVIVLYKYLNLHQDVYSNILQKHLALLNNLHRGYLSTNREPSLEKIPCGIHLTLVLSSRHFQQFWTNPRIPKGVMRITKP